MGVRSAPAHPSFPLRAVMLLLVALALLARVAVPSGWMPMAEGGRIRLALCPETGPAVPTKAETHHAGHGEPAEPDHPDGDRSPCAFAAASLALNGAPQAGSPIAAPAGEPAVLAPQPTAAPGRGLAAPPPFATGPPLHA